MKHRQFVLYWLLAVFGLLGAFKFLGLDGELFAGITGLVGVVIGYYFGRRENATNSVST